MKRPIAVVAEGLGHPEGPCEFDDGRVVFANTYASRLDVYDPATGQHGAYAEVGGGPNACVLGSDGSRLLDPDPDRRDLAARRPPAAVDPAVRPRTARVEILATEADGDRVHRPERSRLRARWAALLHQFRRLGSGQPARMPG